MEWLKKLSSAILYIEENLDREISYDEAARIACCSTYYFQRIFSYVTGISLSEYIRRRRMTQAAFELQYTDKKVLDIALKYGYSSSTSFNRAFQSVHGITPIAAKRIGSTLKAYPMIQFSVKVTGGSAMSYKIEEKGTMRIVGVRTSLVEDMEINLETVPGFWAETVEQKDFPIVCSLVNSTSESVLGVSVYENPFNIYYYIAVFTDEEVPEGMYEYEIPASTWVIFENDGFFKEDVQSVFRRFLTEWLPFSGYEYAGLPDIEVYPIQNGKKRKGHSQVWISIKKKESEKDVSFKTKRKSLSDGDKTGNNF